MCIDMKSHQKVATSHAVAKAQPRAKAARAVGAARKPAKRTSRDSHCKAGTGSPVGPKAHGQARDSACAPPANNSPNHQSQRLNPPPAGATP
ncbi:hypothetical protein GCM10027292_06080 [Hydrogenophaga aquatica]